ncbi:MAG: transcription antitermination protein NusB [Bacilli bacterium]|jgi:transcription antitermination factor NusB|nr:transcription antitermination protein NusB [Bacilli bacterium]
MPIKKKTEEEKLVETTKTEEEKPSPVLEDAKKPLMSRNDLREKTIDALYAVLIKEKTSIEVDPLETFKGIFKVENFADADPFAQQVFYEALKNREEIIALVEPKLNKWKFERLNELAQAIFLEAISEEKYAKATSKAVAISCAVDLAKKYLDAEDYKYINAVLDKVL